MRPYGPTARVRGPAWLLCGRYPCRQHHGRLARHPVRLHLRRHVRCGRETRQPKEAPGCARCLASSLSSLFTPAAPVSYTAKEPLETGANRWTTGCVRLQPNGYKLPVEILIHSLAPTLTAKPAVLDTTKWRLYDCRHGIVDAYDAVLELLISVSDAGEITRIEIGRQPILGRVGKGDCFIIRVKRPHSKERSEGFFVSDERVMRQITDQRRLIERSGKITWRRALAARIDPPTTLYGVFNLTIHLLQRGLINHRADINACIQAIAQPQSANPLRQHRGESLIDGPLDIQAVGADAGLPRVAELREHDALGGAFQIGVIKDDKGRMAAQFQ